MMQHSKTLDMTPIGMIFNIVKTGVETNGRSLEMEWTLFPKSSGTPIHVHPMASERYSVIEGQLEIYFDGQWKLLSEGEEFTVPEGAEHTFRNPLDKITKVYNVHAPAMHFDEYFEGLTRIVDKGNKGADGKLKMNMHTMTKISMLMKKYKKEIRFSNPPPFLVSILNGIGKLRGMKI